MPKNLPLPSSILSKSRPALFVCLVLLPACARKPKHLFSHKETHSALKTSRLTLPAVQDVTVAASGTHMLVSWQALPATITLLPRPHERVLLGPEPKLVGYNAYRFATDGFIPKDSLNQEPITTTSYQDTKDRGTHKWQYLVRGVYVVQGRIVEGPMSQIA